MPSTDSIYEEAKRCPKCEQPGELVATNPHPNRRGAKVETFECMNVLCLRTSERWIVQINDDGTIPVRQKGPKDFAIDQKALDYGKAVIERTKHEMGDSIEGPAS